MASKQSTGVVTHGAVPDPRRESVAPDFDVRLARELRSLLKTKLDGPDDGAVALGARSLSEIFSHNLSPKTISVEEARSTRSVEVDGFTAWPIFITYAGGHRDAYAAIYNVKQVEESLKSFFTSGASSIRGGIGEAIRNVGQHGHELLTVGYNQCSFAPAALFVKKMSIEGLDGHQHPILMAVIADEGSGLSEPERSLLNGVGGVGGDAALGMGVELKSSLLYLVKSNKGEWCLFDSTRQTNPDAYEKSGGFRTRSIGVDEGIERVASLDLPAPPKGCQKIMFFAHPSATAAEVNDIRDRLLSAVSSMQR